MMVIIDMPPVDIDAIKWAVDNEQGCGVCLPEGCETCVMATPTGRALIAEIAALREKVEPNTEPCVICGLYDGEMLDSPLMPEGVTAHKECASRLWDAVWDRDRASENMGEAKERIGREVRDEKGVQ